MTHSVRPSPNCGHTSSTFTWISLAEIWMCAACIASIGALYPQPCSNCGRTPAAGVQFLDRVCPPCRRECFASRRLTL